MKHWLWAAIAASAACALAPSASAGSRPDAEANISAEEAAWVAAEVTGDPSVAQRVLADDYIGVFPDGSIGNKAQAVGFFTPQGAIASAHLDYVHIRFIDDTTAVAQGQETDVRPPGPFPSGRLIFTDVWVLRDGHWQIVNSEDQYQPSPPR